MTTATTPEIGNFSRRIILTGAGRTRNWGGRLATELWQDIMGLESVQRQSQLRELLLEESSFEAALAKVQNEPFTPADRLAFEEALLEAFIAMDREIALVRRNPWINIYKVQDLLFRFLGQRGHVDAGYMFTLNQDLWPERCLYNNLASGAGSPSLPGLERRAKQPLFTADIGPYGESFIMQPITNPAASTRLRKQFNVIKLQAHSIGGLRMDETNW